ERLVDFGENRKGSDEYDGVVARVPGPCRQNDLITRADLQGRHRALKRGRSRGDCQAVTSSAAGGEFIFERGHLLRRLRARTVPAEGLPRRKHFPELLFLLRTVILGSPKTGLQRLGSNRRSP